MVRRSDETGAGIIQAINHGYKVNQATRRKYHAAFHHIPKLIWAAGGLLLCHVCSDGYKTASTIGQCKASRHPNGLANSASVLINVPPVGIIVSTPEFSDIRVSAFVDREREISKFDLSFIFVELGEELRIGIEYNSDMYDRDTAERMGDHLAGLLGAIVE